MSDSITSNVVSGTLAATGTGPVFTAEAGRPVSIELSGTWAGALSVQRSYDNGATWEEMTVSGYAYANFLVNGDNVIDMPARDGVKYRTSFTRTSGTIAYRLGHRGERNIYVDMEARGMAQRGNVFLFNLDKTGTVSATTAIEAALARSDVHTVHLPATGVGESILASPTIPSGKRLVGAGMKVFDRVSTWSGFGTLLKGRVTMTGSVNPGLEDIAIDNTANAAQNCVDGGSDATIGARIKRVATRCGASGHGQLWEKNADTGVPGTDAIGATINDILVEDCVHHGGPNGFVTKMRGVTFRRCYAYDVTSQAYVVVSDNINAADQYSRARDTLIEDCYAIGCATNCHIYSRDEFSINLNTNGVLGALNTTVRGGNLGGATVYGIQIGDPSSLDATDTRIANINVVIDGVTITGCTQQGLIFQNVDGGIYRNCYFAANSVASSLSTNVDVSAGTNVAGPVCKRVKNGGGNIFEAAARGIEIGVKSFQASTALQTCHEGLTLTNYNAGGAIVLTLPPIADVVPGDTFKFRVDHANGITVVSAVPGTNVLYKDGTAYSTSAVSTQRGAMMEVQAGWSQTGTTLLWYVKQTGTWTNT